MEPCDPLSFPAMLPHPLAVRFAAAFLLCSSAAQLGAQDVRPSITAADYDRAAKVLDANLRHALLNPRLDAHWLADGASFWFRRQLADGGADYFLVTAATGEIQPLFDRDRLLPVLDAAAAKAGQERRTLEVLEVRQQNKAHALRLKLAEGLTVAVDLANYTASIVPASLPPKPDELRAPDGRSAVFARGHNLWLRDVATGREKALTRNGEAYFAYGKLPEGSLGTVPYQRKLPLLPPRNVDWSPDGRRLVGTRLDERKIAPMPFIEWVPQDGSHRPISYNLRLNLPGDASAPLVEAPFILEVATGAQRAIQIPKGWRSAYLPLGWSADGRHFQCVAFHLERTGARLLQVDAVTGECRTIAEETSPKVVWLNEFLYSRPNIRLLGGGREAIWFSQRTGWGHLYLYDIATGREKRALTKGEWLVRDIIAIDESARQLYFTAAGREPGWDPYYRALYRVSLDDPGEPVLLTPEEADHAFVPPPEEDLSAPKDAPPRPSDFSPRFQQFVDTYSKVGQPPISVLRRASDGRVFRVLGRGDAAAVFAAGWRAPERTSVKSADGKYDLACVIYYPPGYRADRKYPVIDAFYGGTQMTNSPTTFADAVATRNPVSRASLAELGFIVLTIDARGTPGRSKAFHDVGHGSFADPQIEDHIAGIKELAARLGSLDLTRVGVYGHSFGGYTSARAILSHPEFYKVCVSSAGPHNFHGFYDGLPAFIGPPDYGKGARRRPDAKAVPENFQILDNGRLAKNLRGRLMLVYGDMDENALPSVTLQLADALIKANKTFDLVYLPNRTHEFFRNDPYYTRRMWDYFVEHLLGATPPENYELKMR